MTHALYYKLSMGLNCVVVLDLKNPHTLPPNIFFFRVDGSTIPDKKSQCDKFVFGIQITNPNAIKTTSAHLTADCCGIVVKIATRTSLSMNNILALEERLVLSWEMKSR
jgi:hypothetical protein